MPSPASFQRTSLEVTAVPDFPVVRPGDDLGALVVRSLESANLRPEDDDVFVVAQKIVSKAEGRRVELAQVIPSARALEIAAETGKDARIVEVILSESDRIVRQRPGLLIARHRLGLVMANAGVDQSNVGGHGEGEEVLKLPQDPDSSAHALKSRIDEHFRVRVGVLVSDSVGRAWRLGTVGLALGLAGMPARRDFRGQPDLHGRTMLSTEVGFADQVASAAMLAMGEGAEGTPLVLVRGLRWTERPGSATDLVRPVDQDLFG